MHEFPENFSQGRVVSYGLVALAGFLQWLKLSVLAAFTLLVASFAQTQLFTVVTGFFVLVICHLQYLAQDSYVRGGSLAGRVVSGGIAAVFPNFQLFAIADSLNAADAPTWGHVARIGVYGLGYVAAACGLAVFSFRRREIYILHVRRYLRRFGRDRRADGPRRRPGVGGGESPAAGLAS